jgi:hypothetical protein
MSDYPSSSLCKASVLYSKKGVGEHRGWVRSQAFFSEKEKSSSYTLAPSHPQSNQISMNNTNNTAISYSGGSTDTAASNSTLPSGGPLTSESVRRLIKPGSCFVNSFTIGTPIIDNDYNCPSRFYCPFNTPNVPESVPQICPASMSCLVGRAVFQSCEPQG